MGVGGFADWANLTLQALRIELGKSYRQTIDLLSEMPGVLDDIGLTRLPHYTVLRDWFEKLPMETYRAFLGESAEKRTGHAAVDSTGFDRDQPSRSYAQRAHYRVRSLKVTALVYVKRCTSSTFTVRPRRNTMRRSTRRPSARTWATCGHWLLTGAMTENRSVMIFARIASVH